LSISTLLFIFKRFKFQVLEKDNDLIVFEVIDLPCVKINSITPLHKKSTSENMIQMKLWEVSKWHESSDNENNHLKAFWVTISEKNK